MERDHHTRRQRQDSEDMFFGGGINDKTARKTMTTVNFSG